MFRLLSRLFLWVMGWKVAGTLPPDMKKCIVVAAPHTSNMDFFLARGAFFVLNVPVNLAIKKEVMVFPVSIFLKAVGCVPVNRQKKENFTDSMVRLFRENDEMRLIIAPEGTRSKTDRWKTGFYHIALEAGVPIALGFLDYKKKLAGFGPTVYPTGNREEDFAKIREFYQTITPRYPDQYTINLH